jgi:nucleoside-diphosphate-sugar epimerase
LAVRPLPPEDLDHVLHHTRALWEEMRGQSIFITGGTGFFGMWLLESFVRANDALGLDARAVVLTRDPQAFARKAPHLTCRADLEFVPGDVRTFVFPTARFTYVIHAATEASAKLNVDQPSEMLDAIIGGTRRVLEFAQQCGVRKFLLTSSGAVYGKQPSEMTYVAEDYVGAPDPLLPSSAYGEGKRVSEHMCVVHSRQHGYEIKIARCFAFVGPHLPLDGQFAIGNFINNALKGEPILVDGDGTPMRSYLYASDLAIWLWTILFKAISGRAYNLGSSEALSIIEVARAVARILNDGIPIKVAKTPDLSRPVSRYVPRVQLASDELGLDVKVPTADAIRRTVRWLQS